jgi:GGDEF domain-containing protein
VISLKKFLDADRGKLEALQRMVELLLQGVLVHTVEGAPEDYAWLRVNIQRISEAVAGAKSGQDYLVQAGALNSSLEDYRRRTAKYFEQRRAEMKNIIHMLTATISAISEASNENLQRLRKIEQDVSDAAQIEDVRLIKSKLGECLEDIRRETERQKAYTSHTVEELTRGLRGAQSSSLSDPNAADKGKQGANPAGRALDPVTGLPARYEAETAIYRAYHKMAAVSVGIIVIESLPAINVKYGRSTGDQVLQAFGDFIAQKLAADDQLFRWTGPTLLALLHRSAKIERVRGEFARLMEQKFEHTTQTASHVVHFPVARRWEVLPLESTPEQMYRKIDLFVAPSLERE